MIVKELSGNMEDVQLPTDCSQSRSNSFEDEDDEKGKTNYGTERGRGLSGARTMFKEPQSFSYDENEALDRDPIEEDFSADFREVQMNSDVDEDKNVLDSRIAEANHANNSSPSADQRGSNLNSPRIRRGGGGRRKQTRLKGKGRAASKVSDESNESPALNGTHTFKMDRGTVSPVISESKESTGGTRVAVQARNGNSDAACLALNRSRRSCTIDRGKQDIGRLLRGEAIHEIMQKPSKAIHTPPDLSASESSSVDDIRKLSDMINQKTRLNETTSSIKTPQKTTKSSALQHVSTTHSPETLKEIEERMKTFELITQNQFLCSRNRNKQNIAMECDCTITREDIACGRKGCGDNCLNRLLMIECSKHCPLGKYCGNKKFQNIENAPVEVFKTEWKGFGLRATDDIPADEFVMEYVGEVLDARQFKKRAKKFAKEKVKHFYFMALSAEHCIDASLKGNISRFINHSCDPNAETQKWTVEGELRVGFFTKRKVLKGEEITFDYKYERYGQEAQKCFCGSENCRGWLGGKPVEEGDEDEDEDVNDEDEGWSTDSSEEESTDTIKRIPKVKTKDNQEKKKAKRKPRLKKKSPRKIKNYEDIEDEDEIEKLRKTGIRTKAHTVQLCRLMVRTTDLSSRYKLISLLRFADAPCRRLFLDYHGLKLLHGWMNELSFDRRSLDLKLSMLDLLSGLSIPHKTMLKDSKVLQLVTRWSKAKSCEELSALETKEEEQKLEEDGNYSGRSSSLQNGDESSMSTPPVTPLSVTPSGSALSTPNVKREYEKSDSHSNSNRLLQKMFEAAMNPSASRMETDVKMEEDDSEPLPPGEDYVTCNEALSKGEEEGSSSQSQIIPSGLRGKEESSLNNLKASISIVKQELKDSSDNKSDLLESLDSYTKSIVEDIIEYIVNETCRQESELVKSEGQNGKERTPSLEYDERPETVEEEIMRLIEEIQSESKKLLESWESLKEVFKIPKKEMVKLRAQHEREVDSAAETFQSNLAKSYQYQQPHSFRGIQHSSSYDRTRSNFSHHHHRPHSPPPLKKRVERRISRFDDQSGLLHLVGSTLGREERRRLFMMKVKKEESEREIRAQLQQQHVTKCMFLNLDPRTTPMFIEYPEFYLDFSIGNWVPMPPPNPDIKPPWSFPKMAELPLNAFKEGDEPFPDPAYFYPPGVVPISYLYGPPPEEQAQAEANLIPASQGQVVVEGKQIDINASTGVTSSVVERPYTPENQLTLPHAMEERIKASGDNQQINQVSSGDDDIRLSSAPNANSDAVPAASQIKAQTTIRLPPRWRPVRDDRGRIYFFNSRTGESCWDPPPYSQEEGNGNNENSNPHVEDIPESECADMVDIEMVSTDSESPQDNDEDGDSDDDDDEDEDPVIKNETAIEILSSDLSAQEKSLLLAKKKTKEERQHERRQKRERDRERLEYERKRRRERHSKHRRSGLVEEKFIPKRSEMEKMDLMTFREMRERLANRDLIREEQEKEERMEAELDLQAERAKRLAMREQANVPAGGSNPSKNVTTTAAADTSSEVAKKIKDRFLKDTSKIIVKLLKPYHSAEVTHGRIQTREDFKHLAEKLTTHIMTKELKHSKRIEDLKCTDSVKKKTADYVRKYMLKFEEAYKRSPQN